MRYVVLTCGTNSINKNVPADIINSTKYAIQLIKCKFYNCRVIVSRIPPWDFSPGIQRNKIRYSDKIYHRRNEQQRYIYRPRPYTNFYYKDNLHLI